MGKKQSRPIALLNPLFRKSMPHVSYSITNKNRQLISYTIPTSFRPHSEVYV